MTQQGEQFRNEVDLVFRSAYTIQKDYMSGYGVK
jgi:hypothetical protein